MFVWVLDLVLVFLHPEPTLSTWVEVYRFTLCKVLELMFTSVLNTLILNMKVSVFSHTAQASQLDNV